MNSPILEAFDLTKYYPVRKSLFADAVQVKALDGATFKLDAGKTLAVVGESGCGKSTLARLVTMIEEPTSGNVKLDGDNVFQESEESIRSLRKKVQIVFQDPYGSLNPRQKISTMLEEPLKINTDFSVSERKNTVSKIMEKVGLRPEHGARYPHMFSGGQRQRIAIARALILNPKLVVLDEPVSALDVSIQAQVLNLLVELQEEMNLAYLFISHDLSVVRHFADDVMVMYLGRPVEQGSQKQIFSNAKHPYTQALLSATPVADPNAKKERIRLSGELPSPLNPPTGCPFHPRCLYANERCQKEIPSFRFVSEDKMSVGHQTSCHAVEEQRI